MRAVDARDHRFSHASSERMTGYWTTALCGHVLNAVTCGWSVDACRTSCMLWPGYCVVATAWKALCRPPATKRKWSLNGPY